MCATRRFVVSLAQLEEFGGTFLGLMTYLDLKDEGNSSMSAKQRSPEDAEGGVLRDPRDTANLDWLKPNLHSV
jgi:hypothetical protein